MHVVQKSQCKPTTAHSSLPKHHSFKQKPQQRIKIMEETKIDHVGVEKSSGLSDRNEVATAEADGEINASGHRQELRRNFNLLSVCGVAITTGNTWVTVGGTIVKLSQRILLRKLQIVNYFR